MKNAAELRFTSVADSSQAQRHVVSVRFAETLSRQSALEADDDEALHAFRLCCKRLRFALERLDPQSPEMREARTLVGRLTDELGWAHDCAELAKLAHEHRAPLTAARARRDRDRYVARAARLWRHAFRTSGEFEALAQYAGFTWSLS
ncbi:MAG TPA: CHAD domain-containing protein [Candidatus Baltobacteraceae bacterium]|nr:CHAD domain-containing protein [Candidatus Baltobacteraceae bacterium]